MKYIYILVRLPFGSSPRDGSKTGTCIYVYGTNDIFLLLIRVLDIESDCCEWCPYSIHNILFVASGVEYRLLVHFRGSPIDQGGSARIPGTVWPMRRQKNGASVQCHDGVLPELGFRSITCTSMRISSICFYGTLQHYINFLS